MPRGGHKVRPAKPAQIDTPAPTDASSTLPTISKFKRTNTDWKGSLLGLSRSSTIPKFPEPNLPPTPPCEWTPPLDLSIHHPELSTELKVERLNDSSDCLTIEPQPVVQQTLPSFAEEEEGEAQDTYKTELDTFERRTTSSAASSVYSRSSASIYSRASSIYSSGASIYSFEDAGPDEIDRLMRQDSGDLSDSAFEARLPSGPQYQPRMRNVALKVQDAASRERSTLAKKAALFKNSRLQPELPQFNASLPTWSMVCRAARASQDCYNSHASTRRGTYTPADTSKDIKAMIVDDQLIDDSRLLIVSIRGTQSQSLADWTVNTTANPTKPVGFLDDEENACHAGFLQVTKAMVNQVATQIQQHPASSENPMLLFTGHSAGGAVAAMLYSHMVSTSVNSDLIALTNRFRSINCVTFGAPPVSQTPLMRPQHLPGTFLAFANEGDLVLRTSNAAYFKSLMKLMTASPPPPTNAAAVPVAAPPPPVKVVRGSRGAAVYRQPVVAAPPTPWKDLPLWPTPAPSLSNAGDIILLRDRENGYASASSITVEDLNEVIFGDLAQHTIEMYLRRVKELALTAMMGRDL